MSNAYSSSKISNWLCYSLCGVACRNPSLSFWSHLENLKINGNIFERIENSQEQIEEQPQKFQKEIQLFIHTRHICTTLSWTKTERTSLLYMRSQKLRSQRTRWGKQYFGLKLGVQLTRFTEAAQLHCWTTEQIQVTENKVGNGKV